MEVRLSAGVEYARFDTGEFDADIIYGLPRQEGLVVLPLKEEPVAPLAGLNRKAGYLFQSEALMPWRTALSNVTAGLEFKGVDKAEARRQGEAWLQRVGLSGFGDRYPHQLSGGMRKRVALAQTLILDPEIILMDEPFAALDIQTRHLMENELLELWSADRKSVVFITHDLEEAISLSDRVVVM